MRLLSTGRAVRAAHRSQLRRGSWRARWTSTATQLASDSERQATHWSAQQHWKPSPSSLSTISPALKDGVTASTKNPYEDNTDETSRPSSTSPFEDPHVGTNEKYILPEYEADKHFSVAGKRHTLDTKSNLSPSLMPLLNRRLYTNANHPICVTRKLIEAVFPRPIFEHHTASDPVVTVTDNFDRLGFPADHPGRSPTDTYYINTSHVLRTHTSAHQLQAFSRLSGASPHSGYTICADVFRRDSIDRSHFPVFHQMEGARLWTRSGPGDPPLAHQLNCALSELPKLNILVEDEQPIIHDANPLQPSHNAEEVHLVATHLKRSLEVLVAKVLTLARTAYSPSSLASPDSPIRIRWIDAYFPFTTPSWELEVFWQGSWLELLGCGVVKQRVLDASGCRDKLGWAWGIGVERLAMLLFGIPDIRLFWSEDRRFLEQFGEGRVNRFEPFSKHPECYKDVAFWIPAAPASGTPLAATASSTSSSGIAAAAGGDATKASPAETQPTAFHENDIMELVRSVAGDLVEDVALVDEFVHPTSGKKSLCYRINYRSLERTLTNDEVNGLHDEVREKLKGELGVELR